MPLILVVATVVQFWAGQDIYRAAWAAAKHRATNMNTLVALGTGVAYGYSAFVTLWPGPAERWGLPLHVYFETVAGHRRAGPDGPLDGGSGQEAHRRRRSRALVGLAPRDRPGAPRRRRGRRPRRRGRRRRPGPGAARREGARSTASSTEGRSTVDESMLTGESAPGRQGGRRHRHRRHPQPHRHPRASAPPRSAPTARSPRSSAWSRTPRARRRRCSGWPTRSRRGSSRPCCVAAAGHVRWPGWLFGPDGRPADPGHRHDDRGPDHRLPLRARAGHADRGHGRHRQGRRARHPDRRRRGARDRRGGSTAVVLDKTGTITRGRPDADRRHHRRRLGRRRAARAWSPRPRSAASTRVGEAIVAAARERGLTLPPVDDVRGRARATASTPTVDGRRVLVGNRAT